MTNKDQIIDLSYLKEIGAGNKDFINELIDMFFEQIPEYQKSLNDFYSKKDWYNLGRSAHKAKSAVLMMGMNDLSSDLKKLEDYTKDGKNINDYQEIIAKFVRISDSAVQELRDIKRNNLI